MIAILKVIESFLISFWKVVLKLLFITIPKYLFNQCVKMLKWFFPWFSRNFKPIFTGYYHFEKTIFLFLPLFIIVILTMAIHPLFLILWIIVFIVSFIAWKNKRRKP